MAAGFRRRQRNPAEEVAEFKSKKGFTQKGVDDLVMLPKITEGEIVENLKKRHNHDAIYTNIGPVLIVINPYKNLGLTNDEYVRLYKGKYRHELPPHIFALAEETYRNMKGEKSDQCVIISGESGAGKTVAAKQIMHYIAAVSGKSEKVEYIKSVILESNPLLEAFGNAKTLRNNNSSRFGKYFEIHFDTKGDPIGGKITNYLLEKSRVVFQQPGERNFHIFYQLVNGADQSLVQQFQLYSADNFHYMNQSGCYDVDGTDDVAEFQDTLKAMRTVGMTNEEINSTLQIVSGILHLGNLQFGEDQKGNAYIVDRNVLALAAQMLQVPVENLEYAMLFKQIISGSGGRQETFECALNPDQSNGARDALSRDLYDRMFTWLVDKVNIALARWQLPHQCVIGILDIFGFEIFEHNGFEQFCINYVNEKLQQYFIELTLKAEQEEYVAEGIQWTPIKYFNNKIVCDLIEGKQPPGIFSLLDDICATIHAVSQGTDDKFLQKIDGIHSSHLHFRSFTGAFAVKHYAGEVTYEVDGFCDKNKDTLFQECIDCMRASQNFFIRNLFPITPEEQTQSSQKKRPTTAGFKIKNSANALMATLSQCTPHYIRCIKPNDVKKPGVWEHDRVRHQVQYLGLLENVKVRRAGFAFRSPFDRFLARYKKLSPKTWGMWGEWTGDPKEGCRLILEGLTTLEQGQWQFGKTKVFVRHPESVFHIEERLERIDFDCTVKIQKAWRIWRARRKALEQRAEAAELLKGRKERQRNSGERKWTGDYVNYEENFELQDIMEPYKEEMVMFADNILLLSHRQRLEKRVLLVTETAFYFIARVVKNKVGSWQITRRGEIKLLSQISLSTMADNYLVFHVPSAHDAALECDKKTELIMLIREVFKDFNKKELPINFCDNIIYKPKVGEKDRTLQFIRDEAAIHLSQLQESKREKAKGFLKNLAGSNTILKIGVPTGLPRDTDTTPKGYHNTPAPSRPAGGTAGRGRARGAHAAATNPGPAASTPGPAAPVAAATPASRPMPSPQAQPHAAPRPQARAIPATPGNPQARAIPATPGNPQAQGKALPQPGGRAGPPKLPPKVPPKPRVRALYDYEATSTDELTIHEGDIMVILQKDEGGWWEAEMNRCRGWVPANYVEELR